MTTNTFPEREMELTAAYSLGEALAFVQRHVPAGRVWPVGSAEGFGHWFFLARGELDPASIDEMAGIYVEGLLNKPDPWREADAFMKEVAIEHQEHVSTVNFARLELARLIGEAKQTIEGMTAWKLICDLATGSLADIHVAPSHAVHLALAEKLLAAIVNVAQPLVGDSNIPMPSGKSDSLVDTVFSADMFCLDELLLAEAAWDGENVYRRNEVDALLRFASAKTLRSALNTGLA